MLSQCYFRVDLPCPSASSGWTYLVPVLCQGGPTLSQCYFRVDHPCPSDISGWTYLVTMLTEVVTLLFQDGQAELVHGLWLDVGMALVEVVDQHPTPFEPQHAGVAFVDEALVLCGRHLQQGIRGCEWSGLTSKAFVVNTGVLFLECQSIKNPKCLTKNTGGSWTKENSNDAHTNT